MEKSYLFLVKPVAAFNVFKKLRQRQLSVFTPMTKSLNLPRTRYFGEYDMHVCSQCKKRSFT